MSKLKLYDNGSIATGNSISAGNNISLILGPNNVRGTLQGTFSGASLAYLLTVQNDTYYFAYDIFSLDGVLQVPSPQGNDVILRTYAHQNNGDSYQTDRSQIYETSLFLSTGPGTTINATPVFPFKLISGPAIDNAGYNFDWITIDSALHADGSIICGHDNAADSSNLVIGWDNIVQGNDNIVIGQHAEVNGANNIINMCLGAVPRSYHMSVNGTGNIMTGQFGLCFWKGSYSLGVGGYLNNYGTYNTLLGYKNTIGSSYAETRQSFATGSENFVYGNNSFAIGGGEGMISTLIPVSSFNTKLLGEFSGSIGSCNLVGYRGIPLKAIKAVEAASTFTVTLRRKTDALSSGVVYGFGESRYSLYGMVASSTVDANGYKVYTINATNFSGLSSTVLAALDVDFSSNSERFYWNMAIPVGGTFITNGSGLAVGLSPANKNSYATSPVNSYAVDQQTSGLGSIAIGNNNAILGSRNVFMGNDLFIGTFYDKFIMIGNGKGRPTSTTSYAPFLSSHQDGDAFDATTHSRVVQIINQYATNKGITTSEYNSGITMDARGVTYTARSHTFSCNTVNSTAHKIALNAPLTLSSSYTYGSSLPTTYLQSGRIFFLV